jgi:hypothetical protein
MWWTSSLHKLSVCTWGERWLLCQATVWLGVCRAAVLALPFRWIVRLLGMAPGEGPVIVDAAQVARAKRIGWAVRAAAPRTPWRSACLAQALAGSTLLRLRRIPGTLYLGVAREAEGDGGWAAHAWLRCGDAILTGGGGPERYRVVAVFSCPRRPGDPSSSRRAK